MIKVIIQNTMCMCYTSIANCSAVGLFITIFCSIFRRTYIDLPTLIFSEQKLDKSKHVFYCGENVQLILLQ